MKSMCNSSLQLCKVTLNNYEKKNVIHVETRQDGTVASVRGSLIPCLHQ